MKIKPRHMRRAIPRKKHKKRQKKTYYLFDRQGKLLESSPVFADYARKFNIEYNTLHAAMRNKLLVNNYYILSTNTTVNPLEYHASDKYINFYIYNLETEEITEDNKKNIMEKYEMTDSQFEYSLYKKKIHKNIVIFRDKKTFNIADYTRRKYHTVFGLTHTAFFDSQDEIRAIDDGIFGFNSITGIEKNPKHYYALTQEEAKENNLEHIFGRLYIDEGKHLYFYEANRKKYYQVFSTLPDRR